MSVVQANDEEYRAAHESCAWFDCSDRQQLRVTGPDAGDFLHGQVTNDVTSLTVGGSCYAAVLTAKGAMVGDVRVLRRQQDFIVDTGAGRAALIKVAFEKYLISEDCEVHEAPELAVLSFIGPGSRTSSSKIPAEAQLGELVSFFNGVDVVIERARFDEVKQALSGVVQGSAQTLEVIRVEHAVPAFGRDMTEVTIPLEANLENAIHYKKGCYIGQEVIARATFRGQMNKKLVRLLVGDATPEWKAELKLGERKVGWITSVVHSPERKQNLALGYVHRDFLTPGTAFQLGETTVTVA